MKILFTFFAAMLLFSAVSAQTITLKFVGKDGDNQEVPFDRVTIKNVTRAWTETLTWPDDTVLTMTPTGIKHFASDNCFALSQNNPNPFEGTTYTSLAVAENGTMNVEITDLTGRLITKQSLTSIQPGNHQLRVTLATPGIYFLTARMNGQTSSIKMVNSGRSGSNTVAFVGSNNPSATMKGITNRPFQVGDMMEYTGYTKAKVAEAASAPVRQALTESQTITLQFGITLGADSLPCPSTPTVTDIDGNEYSTVVIGYQCWMRENMKTTRFANGDSINFADTLSCTQALRYFPNGDAGLLKTYGYLYNWPAASHNSTTGSEENPSGLQGICPDGWHVPSRLEVQQMFDVLHSTKRFQCDAHNNEYPENLIAKSIADTTGWTEYTSVCSVGYEQSANNATGFTARPAGQLHGDDWNQYRYFSEFAYFWTSYTWADDQKAEAFHLNYSGKMLYTSNQKYDYGFSVRCVRD